MRNVSDAMLLSNFYTQALHKLIVYLITNSFLYLLIKWMFSVIILIQITKKEACE